MSQRGVNAVRSRRAARSRGKSGALINRGYRSDPPGIKQESGLSSPAMPFISGKQAFLQILKKEGVSILFGNPGPTERPLMAGLAREPGIHYVLALQEAVAIAMADAYAQASGGLAAVNVHVSPGLGNAMGMLYDASKSGAPMLLTAGQHDQSFNVTEPILWSDLPPMAAPPIRALLMRHDLLFSVGGDLFTLSLPDDVDPMPPGLTVVHLDVNPWELGKNYPAEVAILGEPKATLPELAEAIRRHTGKNGHPQAAKRTEAVSAAFAAERAELIRRAEAEATRV